MTVSKIQRFQNEYNELDKQHTIEYNESMRELFKIKEIIRTEEKILKKLEKRQQKKK
jgi:hypothetical protein